MKNLHAILCVLGISVGPSLMSYASDASGYNGATFRGTYFEYGGHYILMQAPLSLTSDFDLTLPSSTGSSGQTLTTDGTGNLSWTSQFVNPMTTHGDIVYGGVSGAPNRLAVGTSTEVLHGGTTPSWGAISAADLPLVGQSTTGAVSSAGQLLGTNTNDNAAPGNVGQYLEDVQGTTQNITINTNTDIATIELEPGDWDVTGMALFQSGTAVGITACSLSVSLTSATHGSAAGVDFAQAFPPNGNVNASTSIPSLRVKTASNQHVYLVASVTGTSGTPKVAWRLSARRVR